MKNKISKHDQNFYGGIIAALAVVYLHDAETIFHEIVGTVDVQALVAWAMENEDMEWSGLQTYGYGERAIDVD